MVVITKRRGNSQQFVIEFPAGNKSGVVLCSTSKTFGWTREGQVNAMAGISTLTQSPLSASDRCDRCGAQAYVRVKLATGELLFCGHHSKEYAVSLKRVAVEIEDQTDRLVESPAER